LRPLPRAEKHAGLADPRIKARLADLGTTPFMGSPGEFGNFIADETEKWAKVIKVRAQACLLGVQSAKWRAGR